MADWPRMPWYMRLASNRIRTKQLEMTSRPLRMSALWFGRSREGVDLVRRWRKRELRLRLGLTSLMSGNLNVVDMSPFCRAAAAAFTDCDTLPDGFRDSEGGTSSAGVAAGVGVSVFLRRCHTRGRPL